MGFWTYPPVQVRSSRSLKIAFLSALPGENVQPPRHTRAVVHDLSTGASITCASEESCSNLQARPRSVTVQTVECFDGPVEGFVLHFGQANLQRHDQIARAIGLLHSLTP